MMTQPKLAIAERGNYSATYQGMGKPGPRPTIKLLFRNVRDGAGNLIADHMWFNSTVALLALDLRAGDQIQFEARVKDYVRKGGATTYQLSYPNNITRLSPPKSADL